MARIAALIVAAGSGERAGGGLPKQYRRVAGVPLLRRTVDVFAQFPGISDIQVVIGSGQAEQAAAILGGLGCLPPVVGGKTRQESVQNGLDAIAARAPDYVLIHDAARPFVSPSLIQRLLSALDKGAECAIPLVAVADTLKLERSPGVWTTLPRDGLYARANSARLSFRKNSGGASRACRRRGHGRYGAGGTGGIENRRGRRRRDQYENHHGG